MPYIKRVQNKETNLTRRKRSAATTPDTVVPVAPTPILTREQYIEDIKVRWSIHQFELEKLGEDFKNGWEIVLPFLKKYREYAIKAYNQEFKVRTSS